MKTSPKKKTNHLQNTGNQRRQIVFVFFIAHHSCLDMQLLMFGDLCNAPRDPKTWNVLIWITQVQDVSNKIPRCLKQPKHRNHFGASNKIFSSSCACAPFRRSKVFCVLSAFVHVFVHVVFRFFSLNEQFKWCFSILCATIKRPTPEAPASIAFSFKGPGSWTTWVWVVITVITFICFIFVGLFLSFMLWIGRSVFEAVGWRHGNRYTQVQLPVKCESLNELFLGFVQRLMSSPIALFGAGSISPSMVFIMGPMVCVSAWPVDVEQSVLSEVSKFVRGRPVTNHQGFARPMP